MKVLATTTSEDSRTEVPVGEGAMRYASPVKDFLRGCSSSGHAPGKTRSRGTESVQWSPAFTCSAAFTLCTKLTMRLLASQFISSSSIERKDVVKMKQDAEGCLMS